MPGGEPSFLQALAGAEPRPYWTDDTRAPAANNTLVHTETADLCIVGGGYAGLWTAVRAKERDPQRDVVLLEMHQCGSAASGRNGGFVEASLTHGVANGDLHFPHEVATLERLGHENLEGIVDTVARYGIDCDLERVAVIDVATAPHRVAHLAETRDRLIELDKDVELLDRNAMQARVASPTYLGGLVRNGEALIVDPARLVWGLKAAAESLGVRIYEDTAATSLARDGTGVIVATPLGRVRARRVALGTNAFPGLLRRLRFYVTPVYDYCLATEPLSAAQLASINWSGREGLSDTNNQFHYYRLTADNSIVWGGYDAVYYFGGRMTAAHEARPETWAKLSEHFFTTFPQLEGLAFSHAWGGAIDTSTRLCMFWDTALNGRVACAAGFTGLGVGATRFAADVLLDLLDGEDNERTRLDFVRKKPVPWPPEPFRYLGIQATRRSLEREDHTGRRNVWLRTLERLGLGFDS
jgi:glycine/D-amino acid oxidase-like deaminating enzyme